VEIDFHLCKSISTGWKLISICANLFPFVQIDFHSTHAPFFNPTHVPLQTQRLRVPFRILNGCQLSRNIAKYCQRDLCHTYLSHWTCHIRDLAGLILNSYLQNLTKSKRSASRGFDLSRESHKFEIIGLGRSLCMCLRTLRPRYICLRTISAVSSFY